MKLFNILNAIIPLMVLLFSFSGCKGNFNKTKNIAMKTITNPVNQNIELGKVTWYRDYDQAITKSKTTNKPILLFFQEVPGCSTCVNFGRDVLSNPLMVEAIENEFIPLAIHNNKPGKDAEILKKYNEPSWNNPVAHFIDSEGKDIISKLANNYQPLSMYNKMVEALTVSGKIIPEYVKLLGDDLKIQYGYATKTVYETPCFWSGETSLAQDKGVIGTRAGWIGNKEVVEVYVDTKQTSIADLDSYAIEQGFYKVDGHDKFRIDKDPQFYLKKSKYSQLPLSPAQRTKINLALPYKQDPNVFLSPKQLQWIESKIDNKLKKDTMYAMNFEPAWDYFNNK